jgi:hypothetical protein
MLGGLIMVGLLRMKVCRHSYPQVSKLAIMHLILKLVVREAGNL